MGPKKTLRRWLRASLIASGCSARWLPLDLAIDAVMVLLEAKRTAPPPE